MVFRRFLCHVDGAADERRQYFRVHVGRRDGGRTLADKDSQADFLAFRAFDIFEIAQTHLHLGRGVADINGVGGIGTGFFGLGNKGVGAILRLGRFQHVPDIGAAPDKVNDLLSIREETGVSGHRSDNLDHSNEDKRKPGCQSPKYDLIGPEFRGKALF